MFSIDGASPGIEACEEEIAVHQQIEIGFAGSARASGEPGGGLINHCFRAVAIDLLAQSTGIVRSAELLDSRGEHEDGFDRFARSEEFWFDWHRQLAPNLWAEQ